jgi:spoIIIJ-associated protein
MSESNEDASNGEVPSERGDSSDGGSARSARRGSGDQSEAAEYDERSEEALAFTSDVIRKMGMDCDVTLEDSGSEEGDISVHITGPDAGRIIGKKGQVLAAVQFIVNRAMNRPGLERRYVSVDADGYRSRREDSLASMARRLGKQAVSDGQIITFEPMSPRDRRVVHLALAKFEGVVTKSEGEGDDRRVQIIPVRRG